MRQHNVRFVRCDSDATLRDQAGRFGLSENQAVPLSDIARAALVRLEGLSSTAASSLQQSADALGCLVALAPHGEAAHGVDALLVGTRATVRRLADALCGHRPPECTLLGKELHAALHGLTHAPPDLTLRGTTLRWGERTYIMGILNVTPDSFSGDGLLSDDDGTHLVERAVAQGLRFVAGGADILDVGGESTRPGALPVDAATERSRVVPVIRALRERTEALISVDTYRAEVARAALDAGADMVNDVWGLQVDPGMAGLVAQRQVPVVIMHNRSKPRDAAQEARLGGRYVGVQYVDLLGDILRELGEQVNRALSAGVPPEHIIVDPGIGFGKTVSQNLYLLNHLDELRVLGYPILVGPSRKSFIGYTLDLPPGERLEGTAAAVTLSIVRGAHLVRVHDVHEMVRVARMTDAMLRAEST